MGALRNTWLNKLLALFLFCAAFAQAAETITYYVPDLAGNPIAALDEQGNLLWKESYRPYGDRLRRQAGEQNGLWFHGMPIDDETELSYFGARWYDPVVGRFMGVDPQRFVEQKLHSFNRYTYGNNNPYRYVDPDGELPLDVIVDAGFVIYDAGRMIGAGAAYAAGALSGNKALRVEAAAGLKEVGVDLGASVVGLAVPYLPAAVTRGATTVAKGASEVTEGTKVYRVWGGKSGPWGESWTTVNPNTVSNFRSAAGLPDVNTGRFVSEGLLRSTEGVTTRSALVIKSGQQGGLGELVIKNAEQKIQIQRVSGVNPEF